MNDLLLVYGIGVVASLIILLLLAIFSNSSEDDYSTSKMFIQAALWPITALMLLIVMIRGIFYKE